jgi:hypothetical protein
MSAELLTTMFVAIGVFVGLIMISARKEHNFYNNVGIIEF